MRVLAMYSICVSVEKRTELCAGNVFGPNLVKISHAVPK